MNERPGSMRDQLKALISDGVDFRADTTPVETQEILAADNTTEQKTNFARELENASDDSITVVLPEKTLGTEKPPRETIISGAREELTEELNINVLPQDNPDTLPNVEVPESEITELKNMLTKETTDEKKGNGVEQKSPEMFLRSEMLSIALSVHERVMNKTLDGKLGGELEKEIYALSEKAEALIQTSGDLSEIHGKLAQIESQMNGGERVEPSREETKKEEPVVEEVTVVEAAVTEKEPENPEWRGVEGGKNLAALDAAQKTDAMPPEKTEAPEVPVSAQKEVGDEPKVLLEKPEEKSVSEEIKKEEAVISAEIEARFQKDFAFAKEDLQNIATKIETPEGEKTIRFSDLSEGQQLLLLENLKDFALDNAKEQALKKFTEEEKEKYGSAGFIKKAFLSYTKSYRRGAGLAENEQDILSQPELNKETYSGVLKDMLSIASEAPNAEWKDGKLQVNFALEKDFSGLDLNMLNREKMVRGFNTTATDFAKIPAEWAYSSNEKEQSQYRETKEAYAKARGQLLNLKAEGGKEAEALVYVADLDKKVQFTQLFQTNPDVEKAFAEIKDQKAWVEGLKAIVKEKGGYFAMGRGLSTLGVGAAVSIGSGFTAPLAVALAGGFLGGSASGSVLGWLTAKKRAGLEVSDTKKLAEMGIDGPVSDIHTFTQKTYDYNKEQNTFTEKIGEEKERSVVQGAEDLEKKLEHALLRVLEAGEDSDKKEKTLQVLADRMHYTEEKLRQGTVSFGEGAEGFNGRYELLSALAKSRTLHEMNAPAMNAQVEQKINDLLEKQKTRVETTEKKYKSEKIRQGVKYGFLLGGTFGTILSSISYAAHAQGEVPVETAKNPVSPKIAASESLVDDLLQKIQHPKTEFVSKGLEDVDKPLPSQAAPTIPHVGAHPVPPATLDEGGHVFPEAVKIPKEIFPEPHGHGAAEILTPHQISIENTLRKLGEVYEVKAGDNVWNILRAKLEGDGQTEFANLEPRQQNFIIDSLKDKIVNMSEKELQEIGIKKDANLIYPGDKLNFSKVFNDSEELDKIFNRSGRLPAAVEHPVVTHTTTHVPSAPAQVAETIPLAPAVEPHQIAPIGYSQVEIPLGPTQQFHQTMPPQNMNHDAYIANSVNQTYQNIYNTEMATQANIDGTTYNTMVNTQMEGGMNPWGVPFQQVPPQYNQWVQQGLSRGYPNMPPEMQAQLNQRMADMMARDGYNNTVGMVNRMGQLFGITTPIQLSYMHSNDTVTSLLARMAWQSAQSNSLPPNVPNPHSLFGMLRGIIAPQGGTGFNTTVSHASTEVNQAIDHASTMASIARSSM